MRIAHGRRQARAPVLLLALRGATVADCNPMPYDDSIRYLYSLRRFGIKLGLSNIEKLLSLLGSPQNRLKFIHVAGTNGKGSTAAFVAAILGQAGCKVGLYTSPHLVDFAERIRVCGEKIDQDEVVQIAGDIKSIIESHRDSHFASLKTITFFEFTTALALEYFRRKGVDLAVMEVGLGGKFDATNVVKPLISVITQVDRDHMAHLGDSVEEIAGQKAGIIKKGVPVFSNCGNPRATAVIEKVCLQNGSDLFLAGRDFNCTMLGCDERGGVFDLEVPGAAYRALAVSLIGAHQVENAALAAAVCLKSADFGFTVKEDDLRRGLLATRLRGRLELLPGSPAILLDGAHNRQAVEALSRSLNGIFGGRRKVIVLGTMKDKDVASIAEVLSGCAGMFIATRPAMSRSAEPMLIKKELQKRGRRALIFRSVRSAVEAARSIAGPDDLICITGSFYTVAEAIEYLERTSQKEGGIKIVV